MTWPAYIDANVLAASKDPKDLQQTPAQTRTAYLDANVHAASMDTKDLKQTPTQYSLSITRTPAIDANQLSGRDPTTHIKNPGHSRHITNAERTASTPSNLTPLTELSELPPNPVEWEYAHLAKLRINCLRRQHAHIRAFIHSTNLEEPSGVN
ncbi:hypothetical protein KY289_008579 [Solanum tuberosum]|nr:hypothetical protein KY289_008579 [Solanum tuberosum]